MSHSGTNSSGDSEEYWRCGSVSDQQAARLDEAIESAFARRESSFERVERHEFPTVEKLGVFRDVARDVLAEEYEQAVRRNFGESGEGYAQQERQTVARVDPSFHPGLSGPDTTVEHVRKSSVAVVLESNEDAAMLRYVVESLGFTPMCVQYEGDRKWRLNARPHTVE